MLEYGKSLFRNNVTQLFCLFLCFGLVFVAKNYSIGTSGLSLHDFVSSTLDNIFSEAKSYGLGLNVVMPFILYLVSSTLLLWMSFSNFSTLRYEDNKWDMSLKLLLASCEGILSLWFFIVGGKLAFYFLAFLVTIIAFIGILVFLFTARTED
ncbi:hypothetical protein FAY30_04265 [Bacillus sp. S3]|uniref:hypothetical protein n=1 Tax=Bacillus sp. S3 TaxID=486398 RepID=UPI00118BCFFF|nr:hypothetical protein [Bacillus sp. S3]QCJ41174.1 hypothetical protein FAY30_04265 [Bacillus sp. S3]